MRERVQTFIRRCLAEAPGREALEHRALALFAWQREHNPTYRRFCADARPAHVEEIPAVPVALFRDLPWCCFPPEDARHVFHTSGTTTGHPGVHRLLDTASYDLASSTWFDACLPAAPEHAISLVPSPSQAPRSSLSHMIGLLRPGALLACDRDGLVDTTRAWTLLCQATEPVFVAATALALATLLEAPGCCQLPQGSVVMTTGGFKGRQLEIEPVALLLETSRRLGGASILGEYGMTELSSQLWTRPWRPEMGAAPDPRGPYHPPPWLVPVVVDPGTGLPLPLGQPGQLRFVDLANDHSVLAIETMDQGVLLPDGGLLLHGRLPGASARGCSLGVEEALLRARGL